LKECTRRRVFQMINITTAAAATTDVDLMAVAYLIIKATHGPISAAAVSAAAAATSLNREEINLSGRGQPTASANRRHLIRTHLCRTGGFHHFPRCTARNLLADMEGRGKANRHYRGAPATFSDQKRRRIYTSHYLGRGVIWDTGRSQPWLGRCAKLTRDVSGLSLVPQRGRIWPIGGISVEFFRDNEPNQ
jgi:hypothetical protein